MGPMECLLVLDKLEDGTFQQKLICYVMNGTVKMLNLSAIPFLYSESSYVEMSHLQIVGS